MATPNIPVIDLSPFFGGDSTACAEAAREIDQACREIGFFTVVGHGVDQELINRTRQAAIDFFALSTTEKLAVERPPQKISRGYFKLQDRSLSYTLGKEAPPDLQEAYAIGPDETSGPEWRADGPHAGMLAPNLWPARPDGFRDTMMDYYAAMLALGGGIMRAVAAALDVDPAYFERGFRHPSSVIRLIRYPAQSDAPKPDQLRAGEHTDYGTITFVRGDDVPGGLQVRTRAGDWIEVSPPPGGFVCNVGDALARWTNDRWVSTLHRVGNPPAEAAKSDRISLVFFHMPDHDAHIECIPGCEGDAGPAYPPLTFADHYLGKLMKAGHARLDADVGDAVR
ncbi:MAG: 2-oxoglutarate and iron-dependent oxygenase domain-containing protein [Alphaproteobacteria bacterium]